MGSRDSSVLLFKTKSAKYLKCMGTSGWILVSVSFAIIPRCALNVNQQSQKKFHICNQVNIWKIQKVYKEIKSPKSIIKLQWECNQMQSTQRQRFRLIYSINQIISVKPFHFKDLWVLNVGIKKIALAVIEILPWGVILKWNNCFLPL